MRLYNINTELFKNIKNLFVLVTLYMSDVTSDINTSSTYTFHASDISNFLLRFTRVLKALKIEA